MLLADIVAAGLAGIRSYSNFTETTTPRRTIRRREARVLQRPAPLVFPFALADDTVDKKTIESAVNESMRLRSSRSRAVPEEHRVGEGAVCV